MEVGEREEERLEEVEEVEKEMKLEVEIGE